MYDQGVSAASSYQFATAQTTGGVLQPVTTPRTVASACGRLEQLNERLAGLRNMTYALADQIGGPRPVGNGIKGVAESAQAYGAVGRLNDSADAAHSTLDEIEETLKAISRSLG